MTEDTTQPPVPPLMPPPAPDATTLRATEPDADGEVEAAGAEAVSGLWRDAVITVGSRLVLAVLIFGGDIVFARLLGPAAKGRFTLALLFGQTAAIVLTLGLERALGVVAARGRATARGGFANGILWSLVVGGLAVVGAVALYGAPAEAHPTGPLTALVPNLNGSQFLLGALALPGELFFAIGLVGLLGRRRVIAYNVIRVVRRLLLVALAVATALVARLNLDAALIVNLVALAISCGAIAWVAAREQILSLRPDMPLLREQLGFGTRTVFGAIAERLQFRADAFLLNVFIGPVATGVYSVASGLAETLWYVPNALGIVVFSRAATGKVESDRIASTMSRLTFAFAVLLAVPVFLLAPLAVEIAYGPAFRDAGFALRFQLPGVIAYSVVAVLSQHIIARGAPGLYTIVLGLGLAANLVANVLLIPRFGLYGAATASSISYAFTALLTLVVFRRMSGLRIRDAVIVRRDDIVFARDALVAFRARRARGRMA